jgi:hypothetical protein
MSNKPDSEPEQSDEETTPATPDPPELAALKNEKRMLDEQAGIAEARKRIVAATSPEVKPLEGEVKIDGDHPIESLILAYGVVDGLSDRIAAAVSAKATSVILHNDADVTALLSLPAFQTQLDLIEAALDAERTAAEHTLDALSEAQPKVRPEAQARARLVAPVDPMVAGGIIRSAVDLLSYFRVDVSLKYKDFTIADHAFTAAVAGKLAEKNVRVYDPQRVPPNLFDGSSDIREKLRTLTTLRGQGTRADEDPGDSGNARPSSTEPV